MYESTPTVNLDDAAHATPAPIPSADKPVIAKPPSEFDRVPAISYWQMFRYATPLDVLLVVGGIIGGMLSGAVSSVHEGPFFRFVRLANAGTPTGWGLVPPTPPLLAIRAACVGNRVM